MGECVWNWSGFYAECILGVNLLVEIIDYSPCWNAASLSSADCGSI